MLIRCNYVFLLVIIARFNPRHRIVITGSNIPKILVKKNKTFYDLNCIIKIFQA